MGLYRVVLEATGGHGCQRERGDGEQVFGCRRMDCPDCLIQEFVEKLNKINPVSKAELIHWPNAAEWGGESVVDEFVMPKEEVKSYKKTVYDPETMEPRKTDEDVHYVNTIPIHRIRHGKF